MTYTLEVPPSANRWWRRFGTRMVLSDEARFYKAKVKAMLHGKAKPLKGDVSLTMAWYRGRKSGDLDKREGILIDALQGVLYDNDKQITVIHAYRYEDKDNPRMEVSVSNV